MFKTTNAAAQSPYTMNVNDNNMNSNNNNIIPANANANSNESILENTNANMNINSNSNANMNVNSNANANEGKGINLYLIYASWCGHSKRALPAFDSLISDYDGTTMNGVTLNIKKYDEKDNKELKNKYSVKGFPSYILEKTKNGGVVGDYQEVNVRTYDGLKNLLETSTA